MKERQLSNRDKALHAARIAGFHDDKHAFTRLVIESRISRKVLDSAWSEGVKQQIAGMVCTCYWCGKERSAAAAAVGVK